LTDHPAAGCSRLGLRAIHNDSRIGASRREIYCSAVRPGCCTFRTKSMSASRPPIGGEADIGRSADQGREEIRVFRYLQTVGTASHGRVTILAHLPCRTGRRQAPIALKEWGDCPVERITSKSMTSLRHPNPSRPRRNLSHPCLRTRRSARNACRSCYASSGASSRTSRMPNSSASAPSETDRASPPGAGAQPGGQNEKPRAGLRRGIRTHRSLKFYASLNQIPPIMRPRVAGLIAEHPVRLRETILGEFRGLARWAADPYAAMASRTGFSNEAVTARIASGSESLRGGSETLDAALAAIEAEIDWRTAAIRNGLEAEFPPAASACPMRRSTAPTPAANSAAASTKAPRLAPCRSCCAPGSRGRTTG
jgi:hypothetical protein